MKEEKKVRKVARKKIARKERHKGEREKEMKGGKKGRK